MKKILLGLFILSTVSFSQVVDGGKDDKGTFLVTVNTITKPSELKKEKRIAIKDVLSWANKRGFKITSLKGGSQNVDVKTGEVTRKFYVK